MRSVKVITTYVLVLVLVMGFSGCKKPGQPPELTREEAALYAAIAKVCPKDDNNSKMEYLTFHIEGWSFNKIPDLILEYLQEYCANGGAKLVQLSYDELREQDFITSGDGDYYNQYEDVYMLGRGKLFTFTKAGDENSDEITVKLTSFITTSDTSGYDIVLKYNKDSWEFVRYANAWSQPQLMSPAPSAE